MSFERKIFLSIYLTLICFLLFFTFSIFYFISKHNTESYIERYKSLNEVIATSFREMDISVEKISANAVSALFFLEKYTGLPTVVELKALARKLMSPVNFLI